MASENQLGKDIEEHKAQAAGSENSKPDDFLSCKSRKCKLELEFVQGNETDEVKKAKLEKLEDCESDSVIILPSSAWKLIEPTLRATDSKEKLDDVAETRELPSRGRLDKGLRRSQTVIAGKVGGSNGILRMLRDRIIERKEEKWLEKIEFDRMPDPSDTETIEYLESMKGSVVNHTEIEVLEVWKPIVTRTDFVTR